jgi:hypothetical protein
MAQVLCDEDIANYSFRNSGNWNFAIWQRCLIHPDFIGLILGGDCQKGKNEGGFNL